MYIIKNFSLIYIFLFQNYLLKKFMMNLNHHYFLINMTFQLVAQF